MQSRPYIGFHTGDQSITYQLHIPGHSLHQKNFTNVYKIQSKCTLKEVELTNHESCMKKCTRSVPELKKKVFFVKVQFTRNALGMH